MILSRCLSAVTAPTLSPLYARLGATLRWLTGCLTLQVHYRFCMLCGSIDYQLLLLKIELGQESSTLHILKLLSNVYLLCYMECVFISVKYRVHALLLNCRQLVSPCFYFKFRVLNIWPLSQQLGNSVFLTCASPNNLFWLWEPIG